MYASTIRSRARRGLKTGISARAPATNPDDPCIGIRNPSEVGGNYAGAQEFSRSDADFVVNTRSELRSAFNSAGSGDVIWIPTGESIRIPISNPNSYTGDTYEMTVPSGVTVASRRDGSSNPGRIYTTDHATKYGKIMLGMRGGARLHGLDIEGPHTGTRSDHELQGIVSRGGHIEVDNCEVHGFSHWGIRPTDGGGHVHHNNVHHCQAAGLGYGISAGLSSNWVYIHHNRLDHCRHAIAGHNDAHAEIYDNLFTSAQTHPTVDKHDPGGRYRVHHNVHEVTDHEFVNFQNGEPDNLEVHHNWNYTPRLAFISGSDGTWSNNVSVYSNHTDSSEPSNLCGDAPAGPCEGVDCPMGEHCVDGDCVPNATNDLRFESTNATPTMYVVVESESRIELGSNTEQSDFVNQRNDGTWHAEVQFGSTGHDTLVMHGMPYLVQGYEMMDFGDGLVKTDSQVPESDYRILFDGETVGTSEILVPAPGPCEGVNCGPGSHCVDGDCVTTNPCADVVCPEGQHCEDGKCVSDGTGPNVGRAVAALGGAYLAYEYLL